MLLPREIWRDIVGFEGVYQGSNIGNVRSMNYRGTGKRKKLKLCDRGNGYLCVELHKNGKRKTYSVHRLIAEAFIENPDNLPCVNHKDENPKNNRVENLEWCSIEYNNNYGTRLERIAEKTSIPVRCIELNKIFPSIRAAAEYIGCDPTNISHCLAGRSKTAGGYHWEYV